MSKPINDANAIADELRSNYGFETEILQNPTRDNIVAALRKYRDRNYADDDQLLVFIAGHGYYNETLKEGFIVATHSCTDKDQLAETSTLSNSTLARILDVTRSKHIFLILDAPGSLNARLDR